jgi:hypothetical protein
MNQERFDDLTRALATNRLSRRQVLKSFVAGALLVTPLGILWNRRASAQTAGCVDSSCVQSAQQAHATCIGESKPGLGKGRCKKPKKKCQQCEETFGNQLLDCGCLTIVNSGTATEAPTYAPCDDPCAPQVVNEQANRDFYYAALVDYLTNEGFVLDGGPTLAVFQENGTVVQKLLSSTFSNPTRPSEAAGLHYYVDAATGDAATLALVVDEQQQTLLYTLAVDDDGQVQQVAPSAPPPQTSQRSTVSITASVGQACNSARLGQCREDVARKAAIRIVGSCTFLCWAGGVANPACAVCLAAQLASYFDDLSNCSRDYGCGIASSLFCKNYVCCGITETSCGGACCSSEQTCCNGICQIGVCCAQGLFPCGDPPHECCGSCQICEGGSCRNCNGCEECRGGLCIPIIGGTLCGNQCVNTATDPNNCGSCGNVCTGGKTCQSRQCECPSGTIACGSQCCTSGQTCQSGVCSSGCPSGQTACGGRCVANCDPSTPQVLNESCVCECPNGGVICAQTCCKGPQPDGTGCQTGPPWLPEGTTACCNRNTGTLRCCQSRVC